MSIDILSAYKQSQLEEIGASYKGYNIRALQNTLPAFVSANVKVLRNCSGHDQLGILFCYYVIWLVTK